MKTRTAAAVLAFMIIAAGIMWLKRPAPTPGGAEVPHRDSPAAHPTARSAPEPAKSDSSPAPSVVPSTPAGTALVFGGRGPVTPADVPAGRFREQLLALAPSAQTLALQSLERLRVPLNDLNSLNVDRSGALFYTCAQGENKGGDHSSPELLAKGDRDLGLMPAPANSEQYAVPVPVSAPPVRHSNPGASKIIYLDFNGHTVSGTAWNTAVQQTSFTCLPFDLDGNSTTFSPAEQDWIVEIWGRVAETYRTFDVDVTTEEPAVFTNQTTRALITKNRDAYGLENPFSSVASGVAYVDVFGQPDFASAHAIAFVYFEGCSAGEIAMIVSHETGHQMSLSHDGTVQQEYYNGHGTGVYSWAPIMGSGGLRTIIQWSKGEYYQANNFQDDVAIIAGKLGTRADDHGDAIALATPLVFNGPALRGAGVIETSTDVDCFSFTTSGGLVSLSVSPNYYALNSNNVSLFVAVKLVDGSGNVLAQSTPTAGFTATVSQNLPAGTYYLRISSTGLGSPLIATPTGFTSYGSLGGYNITGTIVAPPTPVAPEIVAQPENLTVLSGRSASFAVTATGNPAPTYQWQRSTDGGQNWQNLASDGTYQDTATATLRLVAVSGFQDGERFRCVMSNNVGSAVSNPVMLTVVGLPLIVTPPVSQTVMAGASVTFSVTASGTGALSYQWHKDGLPFEGATGATLALTHVDIYSAGVYSVVVSDSFGSAVSQGATLTVNGPPLITLQPTAQVVISGFSRTVVTGGANHSLYLTADGRLWAMGRNNVGQLGDGTTTDRRTPVLIASDVVSAAAGGDQSLFIKTDGTLWAMGAIGPGYLTPTQLATRVTAVAAGQMHALFVKADGTLWVVGNNWAGQLGTGSPLAASTPVQVATGVAMAAGGGSHSLFVKTDGTLWGMGGNWAGQLGLGTPVDRKLPVQLATGVATAAAGLIHSLFLKTDGTLWSMGGNGSGQLGDGSTTDRSAPLQIASGVTAVAASNEHSLFVKADATLWAMGLNFSGQLGDGSGTNQTTPVQVATGVAAMTAGGSHSMFVKSDGTLWTVGGDAYGQLGDGRITDRSLPTMVASGLNSGASAIFTVFVRGVGPLTYQWSRNGVAIDGATGASLSLPDAAIGDEGSYTVTVSNPFGSVSSAPATLTVLAPPTITTEPVSQTVALGGNVTFTVAGTGSGPLSYQWSKDGTPINGATLASLTVNNAQLADGGSYTAVISNAFGQKASAAATLTLNIGVLITKQPTSQAVSLGQNTIAVAASGSHTLYLLTDRTLWAVGANGAGQLGDGTTTKRLSAVLVARNVATMATGSNHSLFVTLDGTLWAMGNNPQGQLGDATTVNRSLPVLVAAGVDDVVAGYDHSLFLKADGTLWAMGRNSNAQLGNGTITSPQIAPIQVAAGVIAMAAGARHSLFIKTDHTLWGMGDNSSSQLGTSTPSSVSMYYSPAQIASGVVSVAAGYEHTLFVKQDDSLWGIGDDFYGQIGKVGNASSYPTPQQIAEGVSLVSTKANFSLFVKTDASLWGMGDNSAGQLGNGTQNGQSSPLHLADNVLAASAGEANAFFITSDNMLHAAGANYYGQLADGTTVNQSTPVAVTIRTPVTFAVEAVGNLPPTYQWRKNGVDIPGATSATYTLADVLPSDAASYTVFVSNPLKAVESEPVTLTLIGPPSITTQPESRGVSPDENVTFSVVASGTGPLSYQWLKNQVLIPSATNASMALNRVQPADRGSYTVVVIDGAGATTSVPAMLTVNTSITFTDQPVSLAVGLSLSVSNMATSGMHSLFVKTDGTLWAMGRNNTSQLGDGTTQDRDSPVQVATGVKSLTAGSSHSLFIKTDGTLWAMGRNTYGQLGDGTTTDRTTPVQVASDVTLASAGPSHSLFVKSDGTLWGMGDDSYGQLGPGLANKVPSPAQISSNVASASAGNGFYSVFIKTDQTLWAMGLNDYGQLGDGTTIRRTTPVQVATSTAQAAAGNHHTLLVKTDGTLWAAGENWAGALGDGTTTNRLSWVRVTTGVASVAVGGGHSLFIKTDGTLYAMGLNNTYQLGDDTVTNRTTPVSVAGQVVTAAAGGNDSLYLTSDGSLWVMGDDYYGQLGDGPTTFHMAPIRVPLAASVAFYARATGSPTPSYQWQKNGVDIPGATSLTLKLTGVQASDAGAYTLTASNGFSSATSAPALLTVNGSAGVPGRLVNLSIRSQAGAGSQTLIVGFVADGGTTGSKASVLVRAAGPVLADYGVPGVMADPTLTLRNSGQVVIAFNDDWAGTAELTNLAGKVGAFPFPNPLSKDAAIGMEIEPTPCTAVVAGVGGATGVVLAEIYDSNTEYNAARPQLANISARAQVDTGANIMIAGFVIGGDTPKTVLIRAVGPTLAVYGVTGVLADPELRVLNQAGAQIDANDNWPANLSTTMAQVGAFALPAGSKDAAIRLTLNPGVYTVQASGVGGTTGVALIEIYAVP